jgi:hypothetical protein
MLSTRRIRRISYPFVEEPKEREKQNDDDVVDDERFGVGVFWVIHFSITFLDGFRSAQFK